MLDLGVVRPGARASGTVYIQNVSDKWLRILSSKPSCTCTSVNLANTTLAPGERIPLRADYHAASVTGDNKAAIRVQFDGYDLVEVEIKANVTMPVQASPGFISAQPVDGVPQVSGEYTIHSIDTKPFRVLAVNGAAVPFVGFDPAHGEPQNTYRLKWDFSGYNPDTCINTKGERMPGWVVVETDHPDCPVFHLEVRSNCTRREPLRKGSTWLMQDKCMLVGGVKPGASTAFELLVNWIPSNPQTDVINSVVSESDQFKADLESVEAVDGGMLCHIRITAAPAREGLIYGPLRVRSNNQSYPLMIIGSARNDFTPHALATPREGKSTLVVAALCGAGCLGLTGLGVLVKSRPTRGG